MGAKDCVFWDASLPGFGVKVTPKGRRVFLVMYRAGARLRKYTIGPYGRITLPMARGHAQKIFAARLDGRDPASEKKDARRRLVVDRIGDLVESFIILHLAGKRSATQISNLLRRDVIPYWGMRSIHEIKKRDIIERVNEVSQRGRYAGNRLLKTLKTFFRWCVGRAVIELSTAEGIPSRFQEVTRDRVLTDQELAAIILGVRKMRPPYSGIIELLALTGQRREEVAQLRWAELDLAEKLWCIPALRAKNNKAHLVHLSEPALAVIKRQQQRAELVFAMPSGKRIQNFSLAKAELDRLSGVTGWRVHDLRRTAVSGMARLGIPPHVADKILNHQSGTISGVAAVYQRHDFLAERKDALDRWGAHVSVIIRSFKDQMPTPDTREVSKNLTK